MNEYKKITKNDIDFPKYCLFFIKSIKENIDRKLFENEDYDDNSYFKLIDIEIDTVYPYCSDAFDLIRKTFEKKGFVVYTPTFKTQYVENVKHFIYNWKIRHSFNDDLPF